MSALKSRRLTVLFVEHDMEIVARYADRVLAFYDGTVIADGPPAAALADPRVQTLISGTRLREPAVLRVAGLDVAIGPVPIIRGASLVIATGEICGLIGRNGAGKTTLLRALMGAIPATGTAVFGDVDLIALPPHRRVAHGIGYMPEDRRLVPHFTVEENIRLPTWTTAMNGVEQRLAWIYAIMPEIAGFSRRARWSSQAASRRWWRSRVR